MSAYGGGYPPQGYIATVITIAVLVAAGAAVLSQSNIFTAPNIFSGSYTQINNPSFPNGKLNYSSHIISLQPNTGTLPELNNTNVWTGLANWFQNLKLMNGNIVYNSHNSSLPVGGGPIATTNSSLTWTAQQTFNTNAGHSVTIPTTGGGNLLPINGSGASLTGIPTSISGTANNVTASATTGAITLNTGSNLVTTGQAAQTITKQLTTNNLILGGQLNAQSNSILANTHTITLPQSNSGTILFTNGSGTSLTGIITKVQGINATSLGFHVFKNNSNSSASNFRSISCDSGLTCSENSTAISIKNLATGGVTSVSGTANNVTSTGGNTPVINLGSNVVTTAQAAQTITKQLTINNLILGGQLNAQANSILAGSKTLTLPTNGTGTFCLRNQTGACGSGGGGVSSITGTANNVTASASTGAVTLNTGSNVVTTAQAAQTITKQLTINNLILGGQLNAQANSILANTHTITLPQSNSGTICLANQTGTCGASSGGGGSSIISNQTLFTSVSTTSTAVESTGQGVIMTTTSTSHTIVAHISLTVYNTVIGDGFQLFMYNNTSGIPALASAPVGSNEIALGTFVQEGLASNPHTFSWSFIFQGLPVNQKQYIYIAFDTVTGGTTTIVGTANSGASVIIASTPFG